MRDITRSVLATQFRDVTQSVIAKEHIAVGFNRLKVRDDTLVLDCLQSSGGDFAVSEGGLNFLNECAAKGRVSNALVALRPRDVALEIKIFTAGELAAQIRGIDPTPGHNGSPFWWFTPDGLPAHAYNF
jgi:hypothetical protein